MGKFKTTRKIELDYVGEDWKDAYIVVSLPSYADLRKVSQIKQGGDSEEEQLQVVDQMVDYVKEHFVEGCGPVEGKLEPMEANDIPDLPMSAVSAVIDLLTGDGALSPKSPKPSTDSSSGAEKPETPETPKPSGG